jgi:hypothetical protein
MATPYSFYFLFRFYFGFSTPLTYYRLLPLSLPTLSAATNILKVRGVGVLSFGGCAAPQHRPGKREGPPSRPGNTCTNRGGGFVREEGVGEDDEDLLPAICYIAFCVACTLLRSCTSSYNVCCCLSCACAYDDDAGDDDGNVKWSFFQDTPLRVLHRRTPLVRKKTIHALTPSFIKPHWFELEVMVIVGSGVVVRPDPAATAAALVAAAAAAALFVSCQCFYIYLDL